MKSLLNTAKRFLADEKAAEVTELGIVLFLVVVASIVALGTLGSKVAGAYSTVNASLAAG